MRIKRAKDISCAIWNESYHTLFFIYSSTCFAKITTTNNGRLSAWHIETFLSEPTSQAP